MKCTETHASRFAPLIVQQLPKIGTCTEKAAKAESSADVLINQDFEDCNSHSP